MTSRTNSSYIIRDTNGTGSQYLVRRVSPKTSALYRWSKIARAKAVVLSYDAARKVIRTYGGEMVQA